MNLYLDIDGVTNPVGLPADLTALTPWTWTDRGLLAHAYAPAEMGDWLRSLNVPIVWATTWCKIPEHLTAYADALDVPHDLRLDLHDDDDHHVSCGKRSAMMRWIEGRPPAETVGVWVDDWMTPADAVWAWQHGIVSVRTDTRRGLASPRVRRVIEKALACKCPCLEHEHCGPQFSTAFGWCWSCFYTTKCHTRQQPG